MNNNKYYTPQSTTLEYIQIIGKTNNEYVCYLKFRSILKHFKYWIDENVWENELEPLITVYEGLNIGKTIWSFILNKKIREEIKYKDIIKELQCFTE